MADRNLTDEDIKAITDALYAEDNHICRFENIKAEDMREAVKFYKNFNSVLQESGSIVRKTIIVIGVSGLVTIIGLGIMSKIKQLMGP
jgi:hypothetical protein